MSSTIGYLNTVDNPSVYSMDVQDTTAILNDIMRFSIGKELENIKCVSYWRQTKMLLDCAEFTVLF